MSRNEGDLIDSLHCAEKNKANIIDRNGIVLINHKVHKQHEENTRVITKDMV